MIGGTSFSYWDIKDLLIVDLMKCGNEVSSTLGFRTYDL